MSDRQDAYPMSDRQDAYPTFAGCQSRDSSRNQFRSYQQTQFHGSFATTIRSIL